MTLSLRFPCSSVVRQNLLLCLLALGLLLYAARPALGETATPPPFSFEKNQAKIKDLTRQIKNGPISAQQLEGVKQQTDQISQGAAACIDATSGQIGRIDQELTSLGPVADREPVEIVKERKSLTRQKQALQVSLSECRLITTLATRLQNELNDQNKILQTANFFSRGQNFFGRITKAIPTLAEFTEQISQYLTDQSGWQEPLELVITLLLAAAGATLGFRLYQKIQIDFRRYRERQGLEAETSVKGRLGLAISLAALLSGCYLLYLHKDAPAVVYGPWLLLSIGLTAFSLVVWRLRSGWKKKTVESPSPLLQNLRFSVFVFLAGTLFFLFNIDLSDFHGLESLSALLRSAVVLGICLTGWRLLWTLEVPTGMTRLAKFYRIGISAVSLLIIATELSGYRNFSVFLLTGCFGTILLTIALRLVLVLIDEVIGGFFLQKYQWQRQIRARLGLSSTENLPGIMWLNPIFKLVAWCVALYFLLQIWGLSGIQRRQITSSLINGITFGGLTIAPARIVVGCIVFACGWTLVAWIKMQLDKTWLRHAYISRSAKETLVTMTGYAGFALVLIIGLSVAGVGFHNLAVIAGALSVGIGFGLQNIVNNFVSGLIILFERPVKRGDWISVGNTEGYVQKISVRSTVIQTFDRSDVIVPNSELISNQVTNMMLNDNHGRLIIPIGVAYGSDTGLVRQILLDIAHANERVINDGAAPKPQVLFMDFGDNSLNFQLRCHLINIDERLQVRSAINYEIDRAFREHNISIPFPQRDIYIKEFPGQARPADQ